MNNLAILAMEEAIKFAIGEYIKWQANQLRDPNYVPSQADKDAFMAHMASSTPEAIEAEVRAELGLPPAEPPVP